MIASSASGNQPLLYGGPSPQHSAVHANTNIEDLQNSKKNPLESESKKLTKKALEELSQDEQAKVQRLKNRDLEVRAHEQAHLSAAGALATGGASFSYTTGPNGVRYATGGEVRIDTSKVDGDPAATLLKADAIRRAALAPAKPSTQDQLIANNASSMAGTARTELIQQTQEEQKTKAVAATEEADDKGDDDNNVDNTSEETESQSVKSTDTKGTLIDLSV